MIITRSAATDKNDSNTSWNDDFVLDNCNDYEGNDGNDWRKIKVDGASKMSSQVYFSFRNN